MLIRDGSSVGERMAGFAREAAAAAGLVPMQEARVDGDGAGASAVVQAARASACDGLLYVGFWRGARAIARARRVQNWSVPAVANSALMYGHADPAWAREWEGWTYADTFTATNSRFAALARCAAAAGRTGGRALAVCCDIG